MVKEKTYRVVALTKEDFICQLENRDELSRNMVDKITSHINSLSHREMTKIASKMGDYMIDGSGFWTAIDEFIDRWAKEFED